MTLKEVAENHGLTPEGVDYALTQYQIVLCEITHGMLSKLSYDAKDVIRIAQDRWCDTCDLKEREEETNVKQFWSDIYSDYANKCKCGAMWIPLYGTYSNYCPGCGKMVRWDG